MIEHQLGVVPVYAYAIPVIIQLALITWGSSQISSGFHLKAICRGETSLKQIVLTFDDGPDPEVTPQILDVLKKYNAPATFFCIGHKVEAHPEIVQRAYHEGHIIANHSYRHGNLFDLQGPSAMGEELVRTNSVIMETIEQTPQYFRPPYGVTTPALAKAVQKIGLTTIGWSVRSMDTVSKDPEKLINTVTSKLKPGDIILFHDTQIGTVLALEGVMKFCKEHEISVIALNELTNTQAYV